MNWISVYTGCCFTFLVVSAQQSCPMSVKNSSTYRLQACIQRGYDTNVPPPYASNITASEAMVLIWFGLKYLTLVDDKIGMYGILSMSWQDERLLFDSDFYDGEQSVSLPARSVWMPPLIDKSSSALNYIFNSGYAPVLSTADPTLDVVISNTGRADIYQFITVFGQCHDSDYSFYPFDVHNCTVVISALDTNFQYYFQTYNYDQQYEDYYEVVQYLNSSIHPTNSGTELKMNIIIKRHSKMHVIMLHVPVFAFLLFNFMSLWLLHDNLIKLFLPIASFCGSVYQIHAIRNLMETSFSHADLFTIAGTKPMHIVLLYRNVILLSLLVLLENFLCSLFSMSRKILLSFLVEYSEAFGKVCSPMTPVSKTDVEESKENDEEEIEFSTSQQTDSHQFSHPFPPQITSHVYTEDYVLTVCDILIVTFTAYNLGYLIFLILHKFV